MSLSNSGFGQMIELTSGVARSRRSARPSTSPVAPGGAGAMTIAAAPSPKIIREVRALPILSENFSTQTSRTGRWTSCSCRMASASP